MANSSSNSKSRMKRHGGGSSSNAVRMFDAVQALDFQDTNAERGQSKRRKYDIQRSKAAKSQTKIYSSLLECRILLQRSITAQQHQQENDLPDGSKIGSDDNDFALLNSNNLLASLLEARKMIRRTNDHNKIVDYGQLLNVKDEDTKQLDDVLESEYSSVREEWKEVFNRRHKDIRLHTGQLTAKSTQFRVMDSSFWEQVESTVQHDRQRHKVRRNNADESHNDDDWKSFDDTKIYQQLLKDFVTTAASQTGREEAVAAQERLMKKQRKNGGTKTNQVDRKASKGRKLRYAEIPKLLNFTFPLTRPSAEEFHGSVLNEDEWFKSLFGGQGAWKQEAT